MKKILTLLSSTAILFALISCDSTPKAEEEVVSAPQEVAASQEEVVNTIPESGAELLVDDMEEGMFWEAIGSSWNDGDVSVSCELSTDWGSDDSTSLKCRVTTNGGEWEKGGFFTVPYETDWSGMTMVSLDAYNPNEFDITLCPVLHCGENWEDWNQFEGQILAAGQTATLTFQIPHLQYLNFVQRVIIYSFGAVPQECDFYIDNIYARN